MHRTKPFDLLRQGAMLVLGLYGALAWMGALADLPAAAPGTGWLHPSAGGMALAAALALSARASEGRALRAVILGLVALSLLPLALPVGKAALVQRLWPADARSWPALLCGMGWVVWALGVAYPRHTLASLQNLCAAALIAGGGLLITGHFLRLDLMYAQPALSAKPVPLGLALLVLAVLLLLERAGQRDAEQREEALISRIGLGVLSIIAFATGLISFTALQHEIESALYQQLQATLQNRQFVFYTALDALHMNAAPLVRDSEVSAALAKLDDNSPPEQRMKVLQMAENLLPSANPSQTARGSVRRAIAVRDLAGQPFAQSGEFLAGETLWLTARRRSEVRLMWRGELPYAVQRLEIESPQRARVGEFLVQHPVPAWELLFGTSFDLGRSGQMTICGLNEAKLRCLRSRGGSFAWDPTHSAIRPHIEAAALYSDSGSLTEPQFVQGEDGRMLVLAYRPIARMNLSKQLSSNGLMMMITLPAEEFYEPLRRHLHRVLLFAVPTIAIGGLLLMLMMRPLVRALRDKQARFRELTELSSDWYWVMDEQLRFTEMVGKGLATAGLVPSDWIGRRVDALRAAEGSEAAASELTSRLLRRDTFANASVTLMIGSPAVPRYLQISGAPQYRGARFLGYRGVCIDVTDKQIAADDLRRAQEALMRSEKLASLGSLVAGVAHELNTPLGNGITAASSLASEVRSFGDAVESGTLKRSALLQFTERAHDSAALIERSLARAAHIVQQFKQVSVDQSRDARGYFDLATLVGELRTVLDPRFRAKGLMLQIDIPPGLRFNSYPSALQQVMEGLCENAMLHAFGEQSAGTLSIVVHAAGDGLIRIEVRDDGRGMSEHEVARAFEPFFTTRLGTGGSGLGLYIVHSIVTNVLGGSIRLNSAPGAGCTVVLEIPLIAP